AHLRTGETPVPPARLPRILARAAADECCQAFLAEEFPGPLGLGHPVGVEHHGVSRSEIDLLVHQPGSGDDSKSRTFPDGGPPAFLRGASRAFSGRARFAALILRSPQALQEARQI